MHQNSRFNIVQDGNWSPTKGVKFMVIDGQRAPGGYAVNGAKFIAGPMSRDEAIAMADKLQADADKDVQAAPLAVEFRGNTVIDIPAGYPNEAALVAFLRSKGYDANVCDSARVLWNGAVVGWNVELSGKFTALFNEFNAKVAGDTDITKADSPLICEYSGCDECIIYSDGGVYASGREWTEGDKAAFIAWRSERSKQDDPAVIKLDGKAWGWTRDSSAARLQQLGVPEHIALAAITLAVLGGKAIVFGADNVQITVERG